MSTFANTFQRHMNPGPSHDFNAPIPSYEDAINPQNARRVPTATTELKPYLGLRSRLSQIWFMCRWKVFAKVYMIFCY